MKYLTFKLKRQPVNYITVLVYLFVISPQIMAATCFTTLGLATQSRKFFKLPVTERSASISELVGIVSTSDGARKLNEQEAERLAALARSGRLSDQDITEIFLAQYSERDTGKSASVIEFIEDIKLATKGVVAFETEPSSYRTSVYGADANKDEISQKVVDLKFEA